MPGNKKKTPMTQDRASAINSANAKSGQDTGKGSFPARANAGAAKNANQAGAGAASGNQGVKK
ncbi:hypothetical protein DPSP01_006096 [Paraphaeosphaeria sporulosa]